jgi:hypothetical protein
VTPRQEREGEPGVIGRAASAREPGGPEDSKPIGSKLSTIRGS